MIGGYSTLSESVKVRQTDDGQVMLLVDRLSVVSRETTKAVVTADFLLPLVR